MRVLRGAAREAARERAPAARADASAGSGAPWWASRHREQARSSGRVDMGAGSGAPSERVDTIGLLDGRFIISARARNYKRPKL